MSSEKITLRKVDDNVPSRLPINVKLIQFGNRLVFAKRVAGRFVPLPQDEQEELFQRHVK
jgi:hypothetical protein